MTPEESSQLVTILDHISEDMKTTLIALLLGAGGRVVISRDVPALMNQSSFMLKTCTNSDGEIVIEAQKVCDGSTSEVTIAPVAPVCEAPPDCAMREAGEASAFGGMRLTDHAEYAQRKPIEFVEVLDDPSIAPSDPFTHTVHIMPTNHFPIPGRNSWWIQECWGDDCPLCEQIDRFPFATFLRNPPEPLEEIAFGRAGAWHRRSGRHLIGGEPRDEKEAAYARLAYHEGYRDGWRRETAR